MMYDRLTILLTLVFSSELNIYNINGSKQCHHTEVNNAEKIRPLAQNRANERELKYIYLYGIVTMQ